MPTSVNWSPTTPEFHPSVHYTPCPLQVTGSPPLLGSFPVCTKPKPTSINWNPTTPGFLPSVHYTPCLLQLTGPPLQPHRLSTSSRLHHSHISSCSVFPSIPPFVEFLPFSVVFSLHPSLESGGWGQEQQFSRC